MQIQVFRPINAQEITRWLQENPRIEVKGFSVAAGADALEEGYPLSVCAILYEAPEPPAGVAQAALAEADQLIEEVAEEGAVRPRAAASDTVEGATELP